MSRKRRSSRISKKRCSGMRSRVWRKGYKTSRGTRVRGVCARKASRKSRTSRKARKGSRRTSSTITKKACLSQAGKRWVSRYRTRRGSVRGSCRSIHNYVAVAPLAPSIALKPQSVKEAAAAVLGFKPRTAQPYQAAQAKAAKVATPMGLKTRTAQPYQAAAQAKVATPMGFKARTAQPYAQAKKSTGVIIEPVLTPLALPYRPSSASARQAAVDAAVEQMMDEQAGAAKLRTKTQPYQNVAAPKGIAGLLPYRPATPTIRASQVAAVEEAEKKAQEAQEAAAAAVLNAAVDYSNWKRGAAKITEAKCKSPSKYMKLAGDRRAWCYSPPQYRPATSTIRASQVAAVEEAKKQELEEQRKAAEAAQLKAAQDAREAEEKAAEAEQRRLLSQQRRDKEAEEQAEREREAALEEAEKKAQEAQEAAAAAAVLNAAVDYSNWKRGAAKITEAKCKSPSKYMKLAGDRRAWCYSPPQ